MHVIAEVSHKMHQHSHNKNNSFLSYSIIIITFQKTYA